jgi:glutamate mutase epsilon subunit
MAFISSVRSLPGQSGKYLILPIDRNDIKLNIDKSTLQKILTLSEEAGVDVLENLVDWLTKTNDTEEVVNKLKHLEVDSLSKLNSIIGISSLKKVIALWQQNQDNRRYRE